MMISEVPSKSEVAEYTLAQQQVVEWREKCAFLLARNLKLEQENEVLRHCWDKAKEDIDKLTKRCNVLQEDKAPC